MDLNTILNYVVDNKETIIFGIFGLTGLGLMGRQKVKNIVVEVMLQAEKHLAESGETKKEYVVEVAYSLMPPILKPFVSQKMVSIITEGVLEYIKKDYEDRLPKVEEVPVEAPVEETVEK